KEVDSRREETNLIWPSTRSGQVLLRGGIVLAALWRQPSSALRRSFLSLRSSSIRKLRPQSSYWSPWFFFYPLAGANTRTASPSPVAAFRLPTDFFPRRLM